MEIISYNAYLNIKTVDYVNMNYFEKVDLFNTSTIEMVRTNQLHGDLVGLSLTLLMFAISSDWTMQNKITFMPH